MSSPTQLDQLIAETVPRTSLRDALVMFLGGLAQLVTDETMDGSELEEKKGTVADALVANTPVAPSGLGGGFTQTGSGLLLDPTQPAGPVSTTPPKHPGDPDPNLPDPLDSDAVDDFTTAIPRQPGSALFPHEVAVGGPDQTLPAEERVDHSLDELHEQVAADAELRQHEALATDDAGIAVDPNL